MIARGFRGVANPSQLLISQHEVPMSGHAIACTVEGIRLLLIEVQALVRRFMAPHNEVQLGLMLNASICLRRFRKRAGFQLGGKDVFLNITGGISSEDPALDLAVVDNSF